MIHYPSIETLSIKRMNGNYNRWKRLQKEKHQHKQNCYKAQKIKERLLNIIAGDKI